MFASGNAKTCLARGMFKSFIYCNSLILIILILINNNKEHCDPVGENSVWGSFSNKIDSKDGKKIIILSSQLDGNSLFHDFTNGVDSQLAGTVANLAIIDALSKVKKHSVFIICTIVYLFTNL